jgi:1-pyrroline-5-carboxylate dehydrogenase
MNANTQVPGPINEVVRIYEPGKQDTMALANEFHSMRASEREIPLVINGKAKGGHGKLFNVVEPHNHKHVLGVSQGASETDVVDALASAKSVAPAWRELPFDERAAVFLKAADLLAGPWRNKLVAATMLGQSKTCYQAEIDAACELIDFWRFNVSFAHRILSDQPSTDHWKDSSTRLRPSISPR